MYLITQNVILDQFADDFPISLKNIFYVQKLKMSTFLSPLFGILTKWTSPF